MTPQSEGLYTDSGLQALEIIHRDDMIDEQWTERSARSFSWIGYRLRQTFEASPPFDEDGIRRFRICARVPVVDRVSAPVDEADRILADVNRYAIGSAYVYEPEGRGVVSVCSGIVDFQTVDWRGRQIGSFAMCQLGQAETEADYLASVLKGVVAVREHRTSGAREQPDEMVSVIDAVLGKHGTQESLFAKGPDFHSIAEVARHNNTATLGGDEGGVAIEVPFAQETSLIQIRSRLRHRRIGHGLSFILRLPLALDHQRCAQLASSLNREEASGASGGPQLGAWCRYDGDGKLTLAFAGFVPNGLYRPEVTRDVFYSLVKRARWANQFFNPNAPEADSWDVMRSRLAQSPDSVFGRFRRPSGDAQNRPYRVTSKPAIGADSGH